MISASSPHTAVIALIQGRWRSQVLHAGTALGVFEVLDASTLATADELACRLGADRAALYRLLRALASLDLLEEDGVGSFRATAAGACLASDHPRSLRAMALLEEGPAHYAAWRHLPDIVRSGVADGFRREFGHPYWDHLRRDPAYARDFSRAMSSYSASDAPAVRRALRDEDFAGAVLCDVGGSHGALLAELLEGHPTARGVVLDLPEVVAAAETPAGEVGQRLGFIAGDMFAAVPRADAYLLKHILHDWPDEDCCRILAAIRAAAQPGGRLFVCEFVVPGPGEPHLAKLMDIHMMVVQDGRQRTAAELASLLSRAGWRPGRLRAADASPLGILEASAG